MFGSFKLVKENIREINGWSTSHDVKLIRWNHFRKIKLNMYT